MAVEGVGWQRWLLTFAGCLLLLIIVEQGEGIGLPALTLTLVLFALPLGVIILSHTGMIARSSYPAWALACASCVGGLYLMTCNPWVSVIGDNIVNIRDALRLLRGEPLLDTQYGLGFKILLVPPLWLFDHSVTAMKVVVASTGVLFPLFCFLVLRQFTSPSRALTISVLSAVLPVSVSYSSQLIADLPYASFSLLALYVTLRYVERPGLSWPGLIGASCALGWAFHIKSARPVPGRGGRALSPHQEGGRQTAAPGRRRGPVGGPLDAVSPDQLSGQSRSFLSDARADRPG